MEVPRNYLLIAIVITFYFRGDLNHLALQHIKKSPQFLATILLFFKGRTLRILQNIRKHQGYTNSSITFNDKLRCRDIQFSPSNFFVRNGS